jgi:hypothetical protein
MASTGFQSRLQQKEKKTIGVQLSRMEYKGHKHNLLMTSIITPLPILEGSSVISLHDRSIRFSQNVLSPVHQSFPRTAAKGKQVRFDSSNKENIQKGMVSYRR